MHLGIVKTIKVIEEYTGKYFHDLGIGNNFLDKILKALIRKEKGKINETSPKLKISPHRKVLLRKQSKLFTMHIIDKGQMTKKNRKMAQRLE